MTHRPKTQAEKKSMRLSYRKTLRLLHGQEPLPEDYDDEEALREGRKATSEAFLQALKQAAR